LGRAFASRARRPAVIRAIGRERTRDRARRRFGEKSRRADVLTRKPASALLAFAGGSVVGGVIARTASGHWRVRRAASGVRLANREVAESGSRRRPRHRPAMNRDAPTA
jgi:hypothetical protein